MTTEAKNIYIYQNIKAMATKDKHIKSVSIKMSFRYATQICIMTLESGTEEGKKFARIELLKFADELDRLEKSLGSAKPKK